MLQLPKVTHSSLSTFSSLTLAQLLEAVAVSQDALADAQAVLLVVVVVEIPTIPTLLMTSRRLKASADAKSTTHAGPMYLPQQQHYIPCSKELIDAHA